MLEFEEDSLLQRFCFCFKDFAFAFETFDSFVEMNFCTTLQLTLNWKVTVRRYPIRLFSHFCNNKLASLPFHSFFCFHPLSLSRSSLSHSHSLSLSHTHTHTLSLTLIHSLSHRQTDTLTHTYTLFISLSFSHTHTHTH